MESLRLTFAEVARTTAVLTGAALSSIGGTHSVMMVLLAAGMSPLAAAPLALVCGVAAGRTTAGVIASMLPRPSLGLS